MKPVGRRTVIGWGFGAAVGLPGLRVATAWSGDSRGPRERETPMIYLDNAATSFPKPEPVYRAVEACLRSSMANPWQAQYPFSAEAQRAVEDARRLLNDVYRGEGPGRWVHTFNGTDSLNMAIKGVL